MPTSFNILNIRRSLGIKEWKPPQPFGPNGWIMQSADKTASVILSAAEWEGQTWVHASISRPKTDPTYKDLVMLKQAVWGPEGWAYQVFASTASHVNIHPHALHLWGLLDGSPVLPDFGFAGMI